MVQPRFLVARAVAFAVGWFVLRAVARRRARLSPMATSWALVVLQLAQVVVGADEGAPGLAGRELLALGVAVGVLALWPAQRRTPGPRPLPRFPFTLAARALLVGLVLLPALVLGLVVRAQFADDPLGSVGWLLLGGTALLTPLEWSRYLAFLGARLKAATVAQATAADARAPVLLLRAFSADSVSFRTSGWFSTFVVGWPSRWQNLEELLTDAVTRNLGPFVALGSPEDFAPTVGAAKQYEQDTTWKAAVAQLVARAQCVLVVEGATDGLRWELGHLRAQPADASRCFIFTLPPHVAAEHRRAWPVFRAALQEAGITVTDPDPGCGAVLRLVERDGGLHTQTLRRGARTGDDYVDAVRAALGVSPPASQQAPGRLRTPRTSWLGPAIGDTVLRLVFMGVLAALLRGAVETFRVTSTAMAPTLLAGDHVLGVKLERPRRGDVIAFTRDDASTQPFVARVLALEGETVTERGGLLFINDWPVPRCPMGKVDEDEYVVEHLGAHAFLTRWRPQLAQDGGPWTVEPGELFVVGDERTNSYDSRRWPEGSGVPTSRVRARLHGVYVNLSGEEHRLGVSLAGPPTLPGHLSSLQAPLDACLSQPPTVTEPP